MSTQPRHWLSPAPLPMVEGMRAHQAQQSASADRTLVPSHVPSGAVLLALELSREARGVRGLDALRRSADRAPPVMS